MPLRLHARRSPGFPTSQLHSPCACPFHPSGGPPRPRFADHVHQVTDQHIQAITVTTRSPELRTLRQWIEKLMLSLLQVKRPVPAHFLRRRPPSMKLITSGPANSLHANNSYAHIDYHSFRCTSECAIDVLLIWGQRYCVSVSKWRGVYAANDAVPSPHKRHSRHVHLVKRCNTCPVYLSNSSGRILRTRLSVDEVRPSSWRCVNHQVVPSPRTSWTSIVHMISCCGAA